MVALRATQYGLTRPYFFQQGQHLNGQTSHDKLLPFHQKEGSNTKISDSNRMELAVILIKRFSNDVRTLNSLFQRTDVHLTRLNSQLQLDINAGKNTKYDFCFKLLVRFFWFLSYFHIQDKHMDI